MKNKKIQIISDTHGLHNQLQIEKDLDIIIHCGDSTNHYEWFKNQPEFEDFISWYSQLPVKNKVLIAGNHDAWALKQYNRDKVKDYDIIYLEHEYHEIENILLFGSPYTPTFGNWHFMKDRSKLGKYWESLIENIDVLITHGPPKFMLDLSHNRNHQLEYCGDNALFKAVLRTKPKYHCFGHIHNSEDCYNQGVRKFQDITFINASCTTDGKFGKLTSHGIII